MTDGPANHIAENKSGQGQSGRKLGGVSPPRLASESSEHSPTGFSPNTEPSAPGNRVPVRRHAAAAAWRVIGQGFGYQFPYSCTDTPPLGVGSQAPEGSASRRTIQRLRMLPAPELTMALAKDCPRAAKGWSC